MEVIRSGSWSRRAHSAESLFASKTPLVAGHCVVRCLSLNQKAQPSPPLRGLTICTADSVLRMNNALASTEDVLDVFPDEAISACAAIRSLHYAARNGCELIKSEFGVGHWIEVVVEGHPLSMNTPSLESMAEVMTGIKRCCDLAHSVEQAIKNPAGGGVVRGT